jgi:GntR family transcriptional regulator/MocR family aminotransferase
LRSLVCDLLQLRLDEQTEGKLHKKLYNAIRLSILEGSLPPQSRLPPSRDLAAELHLSRNTVLTVYEQLVAEGYVVSRAGSGTFVAQTVPDSLLSAPLSPAGHGAGDLPSHLSSRGQALLQKAAPARASGGIFARRARCQRLSTRPVS